MKAFTKGILGHATYFSLNCLQKKKHQIRGLKYVFQVGEVEEEREEERERQELKRRNYQLVVERAAGRRRGSNDSVEDQVLIS